MLIIAARVIRIICAVTTSVSVNAGRKQTYNFSSSGVDDEMFDNYVDVEEHWERWSDVVSDVTAYAERVGTTVVELTCD